MNEVQTVGRLATDLTRWNCGEESLKETLVAVDPHAFRAENAVAGLMKFECAKCGVQSSHVRQALHNKLAARKSRKATIKAANGKSS